MGPSKDRSRGPRGRSSLDAAAQALPCCGRSSIPIPTLPSRRSACSSPASPGHKVDGRSDPAASSRSFTGTTTSLAGGSIGATFGIGSRPWAGRVCPTRSEPSTRPFAIARGKSRYADKNPAYVRSIPLLASLFTEARFIHLIRDGRDVAVSLMNVAWRPDSLSEAASHWRERVLEGRNAGREVGPDRSSKFVTRRSSPNPRAP